MMELAAKVNGVYLHMDNAFGGQCWDSAAWIANHFGLPVINTGGAGRWPGWAGNMVDAFPQTPEIAAAYELVAPSQRIQPGDTLVWDNSYKEWFPATHVATAVKPDSNGWVLCLSQNSSAPRPDLPGYSPDASGPTILQHLPKRGLLGILRPRTGSLAYQGGTTTPLEEIDMAAAADILARLTEIVTWQEAQFRAVRENDERNRNALAEFFRAIVSEQETLTREQLDAKLAEFTKPRPEAAVLVVGDTNETVYAWDGGSGYRAISLPEFLMLMSSGAILLPPKPQAELDAAVGGK